MNNLVPFSSLFRNSLGFLSAFTLILILSSCSAKRAENSDATKTVVRFVRSTDSSAVIAEAENYMNLQPVPLTNFRCDRSLGGGHDFYSEGDYWWPNPDDPNGPYIRRDGETNPENFKDHRIAMRNMSIQTSALTAAYLLTNNPKYAEKALQHFKVWFVDLETRMNPNMNFAQAIKGICPGRGVGLIDGIHLVEPALCVEILADNKIIRQETLSEIKSWFSDFLKWMTTHEYGIDERDRKNNHGTCWVMQAAAYAKLTGNKDVMDYCRDRYKNVLLPNQMAEDGGFPLELKRTKPYGYSLFNMDAMAAVCQILSDKSNHLWQYSSSAGLGMEKAMSFISPYIKDKSKWPLEPDVMYWDEWPVRHPALLFAGIAFDKTDYLDLWKSLKRMPDTQEGLRNFPIRQPVIWIR